MTLKFDFFFPFLLWMVYNCHWEMLSSCKNIDLVKTKKEHKVKQVVKNDPLLVNAIWGWKWPQSDLADSQ